MKKLILSVTAISAMSLSGFAQGITFSDGATPAYDTTIAGVPNAQDLNLELLFGASAGTVSTPIVTLLLSSSANPATSTDGGVYTAAGDVSAAGYILDNSGTAYSVPGGATDYFQVEAWTGAYSSYAAALAANKVGVYAGASGVFTEAVPAGSTGFPVDITGVGIINLTQVATTVVPEPSTLAMAGVGLASMLMFRRKNK